MLWQITVNMVDICLFTEPLLNNDDNDSTWDADDDNIMLEEIKIKKAGEYLLY